MVSEEYSQKLMAYSFRAAEISAKVLLQKLNEALKSLLQRKGNLIDGQQTLKQLERYKRQLASVELPSNDLKSIKQQFAAFKVDFSLMKNKETGDYTIFFKAQDSDRIQLAIEKVTSGLAKPSILDKLNRIVKEQMQQAPSRAIEKIKAPIQPER